ncbi:hypothetical protein GF406_15265 [candidate division KSB1 bacterium]|nr:hypothetical protein [candidate division KSB1 bacterium]
MDFYFDRLLKHAQSLGNHHRKYVVLIEKNIDPFMARLEQAMMIEQIHLWAPAHNYSEEMRLISQVGGTLDQKLQDLGCYFALQFLQMNLSALDALKLQVTTRQERFPLYKEFMLRVGHDFRKLTAAYMEQLLELFLPPEHHLEYVFLGVGTRSDQDDIDLGVVDRGENGRELLNKAVSRMNGEMFKKAISLHFHLSEHVGSPLSFSASIDEYIDLLEKEIQDFVIITEMLGAARVLGSRRLFSDFRRMVTFRYYQNPHDTRFIKFHEGYLRGIVGECRSFVLRRLSRDHISPKGDGLRMIKAGLFAAKSIFNLRQVNAWTILDTLQKKDKKRRVYYEELEKPLTFLEIFRYLYQLLIAQEEEIILDEPSTMDNLSMVAEAMGYGDVGAAHAKDFLLIDYYKNIHQAKDTIQNLLPNIVNHLSNITIFGKMLQHRKVTSDGEKRLGNFALRFLHETRFFKGTRFWDDIISVLGQKNGQLLKRMINDLNSLSPNMRDKIMDEYVDWAWNSFIASFHFLILLHRYRDAFPNPHTFKEINARFLARFQGSEEECRRLSTVYKTFPVLVFDYIRLLTDEEQKTFYHLLKSHPVDRELVHARDRLQHLLKLHFSTSKFFRRILHAVLVENPEYLHIIDQPGQLVLVGKGHLADVARSPISKQKLEKLKSYHDIEFFRVCQETLRDSPPQTVAMEFTEFSDTYIRLLFDTCKHEIDGVWSKRVKTKDLLGIFVTGGHGHMLAFDDDFDMIILLNSDDQEIHRYASKIIGRMHSEIVKSGIMPHYRLSDYTTSYICTFAQLQELLDQNQGDQFIDKSQLLGARMIVGSTILQQAFESHFIQRTIFDDYKSYALAMIQEIHARHRQMEDFPRDSINLKEYAGGLRDIEMFLLICRAVFKIKEHSNFKLLRLLAGLVPSHSALFNELYNHYELLRKVRNLNRLMIAARDDVDCQTVNSLYTNLLHQNQETRSDPVPLFERLVQCMSSVMVDVDTLLDELILPLIK